MGWVAPHNSAKWQLSNNSHMISETRFRSPLTIEIKLIKIRPSCFILYYHGEYCGWMDDTSLKDSLLSYARNLRVTYI